MQFKAVAITCGERSSAEIALAYPVPGREMGALNVGGAAYTSLQERWLERWRGGDALGANLRGRTRLLRALPCTELLR